MKKTLKVVLFILVCIVGSINAIAEAATDTYEKFAEDGSMILVCDYRNEADEPESRIYYVLDDIGDSNLYKKGHWVALMKKNGYLSPISNNGNGYRYEPYTIGTFEYVFVKKKYVTFEEENQYMNVGMESEFTCPEYASYHNTWPHDDICYSNTPLCGKYFDKGDFNLKKTGGNSIFNVIDDYAKSAGIKALESEEDVITKMLNGIDIIKSVETEVKNFILEKYNFSETPVEGKYELPSFVNKYLISSAASNIDRNRYEELHEKAKQKNQDDYNNGTIEESQYQAQRNGLESTTSAEVFKNARSININLDPSRDDKCNGLLGPQMTEIVQNVFDFIKYLGPILIAVLSIVDFVKAAVSGDDGDTKKASQKLMKRIICGILLFFIPLICQLIFDFAGITVPEYCIEQYKETK